MSTYNEDFEKIWHAVTFARDDIRLIDPKDLAFQVWQHQQAEIEDLKEELLMVGGIER